MNKETLINVIDTDDYNFSQEQIDLLFGFHSHGYDYPPDGGYSIFIRHSSLIDILDDIVDECPYAQELIEAFKDFPHKWTVILAAYE